MRESRKNPAHRARFIFDDCRKIDKKTKHVFNLDIEFIDELIAKGCTYCGGQPPDVKMSLDRIDNSIGHIKTNVLSSCIDCNLTRGTMPFDAWTEIAPIMRKLRLDGKLKGWHQRSLGKY